MKPIANSEKTGAARISAEPLENLRGSNAHTETRRRKQRMAAHGLEESPVEARARFHSELLDRVREEVVSKPPAPARRGSDLLETIDAWEESFWSGVDGKTAG